MTKDTIDTDQKPTQSRSALLREFGYAWRRRRSQAKRSWRETVTLFKPEPWLVALAHDKARSPVKLRDQPEASK
ncbi:hypothetical protein AUC70_03020 [Methyloceanibacter stevinii]|uniref:Uncharacterized protein n=1 Tax=Methyloceanibacter stevinii TaxID=1774970 RepID=A0A1E3VQP5_9HYPH|nr:hypothetical protein [Methyloceanibacter stevinii]ODR95850.1 hypothetical protein AUC70_03020 [Methyloceanibacter stevinii]